jgi:crotonobetainyl-CoA:carnitine CoA-transferase CaiB-like acyl-CoA transferase
VCEPARTSNPKEKNSAVPGPLESVRILDLTSVILGPYATQILGDLGADVIKIESPEGDANRQMTPGRHRGMGGASLNLNRNKRSVAIDLKRPAGREAVLRIAATADVFIHNMRPQAVRRLGLTYEDVRAVRPDIVYCSTIGFRSDGPYGAKAAYDDMIQGGSGLAALLARFYGTPGYVPATLCDKIVALAAVYAVTAALFHRARTGEGQAVEVPMFETMVAFNLVEHIADAVFEPPQSKFGYPRVLTEYRRPYATADGYLCVLPYTDRQWRSFVSVAGRPELADDPLFRDFASRAKNVAALYACIEDLVRAKPTAEWLRLCDQNHIPAMPVNEISELPDDPHLVQTGFFTTREHPSEGRYRAIGSPVRFQASPAGLRRDAPRLGENGTELLAEVGYTAAEIEALAAAGTVILPGDGG